MAELILGTQVLKIYGIDPNTLFHHISKGELTPYSWDLQKVCRPDRKPPAYIQQLKERRNSLEIKKWEAKCNDDNKLNFTMGQPSPEFETRTIDEEITFIDRQIETFKMPGRDPYSWINFKLPKNKADANALLRFLCNCHYRDDEIAKIVNGKGFWKQAEIDDYIQDNSNRNKLLPNQLHKIAVRKAAKIEWQEDPSITIADMIQSNRVNSVCDGITYAESTLRKWIKDLCPNRTPGRRSKTIKTR